MNQAHRVRSTSLQGVRQDLIAAQKSAPVPPADCAFVDAEHERIWNDYASGRSYSDWTAPELRLLWILCMAERELRMARDQLLREGFTVPGRWGAQTNPIVPVVRGLEGTISRLCRQLALTVPAGSTRAAVLQNAGRRADALRNQLRATARQNPLLAQPLKPEE